MLNLLIKNSYKIIFFVILALSSAVYAENELSATNLAALPIAASPTPPQSFDGPTACQSGPTLLNIITMIIDNAANPTTPEAGCFLVG